MESKPLREAFWPPTESPNPVSKGLDARNTRGVLEVIHQEDLRAWEAVGSALDAVAEVVDAVVEAFRAGGRLVYAGAGTSGRLGVLDAAECPPTFGVTPDLVQAVIAGGDVALRTAVEGAEDDREAGAEAIARLGVRPQDVVCGIAASGTTPFVWGALEEALRRDATTALITSNVCILEYAPARELDYVVVLPVGPEVIAGSTRMKSGTATKMVLNMITTAAMVRWGKVYDNLMVDLTPTSEKLRRRARRLVCELGGVNPERAEELLREAGGRVKAAVIMARAGVSAEAAREALERNGGLLRNALRELGTEPP